MTRFAAGPLHGTALALYFVLLPYVVITRWSRAAAESDGALIRGLLVVLALFWLLFLIQLVNNIRRLRHGGGVGHDGSAWLAGLVVILLPFLVTPHASSVTPATPVTAVAAVNHRSAGAPERLRAVAVGPLPLALMAKRRRDELRQHEFTPGSDANDDQRIDEAIELLRADDPELIGALRNEMGDRQYGVIEFSLDEPHESAAQCEPVVACALDSDGALTRVAFAREGSRLEVPPDWGADDLVERVVALHEAGRVRVTTTEHDLLRALATRASRATVVIYVGGEDDLDDELRRCAVLVPMSRPDSPTPEVTTDPRVELLRADPQVVGLASPFTATLRRRCVEMTAYLAMHAHEPVTGERLRARVLAHADADASNRTLANTASSVRRSLGADGRGPRLHAVSSSGLYATHGLECDVEIFHELVSRARTVPTAEGAALARRALALVQGEPLASALRGFEWFLAEGHAARLAREGEWAALLVHHDALARGDVELAYWALERGRLIDPYSDALGTALAAVPRLREFGGDGAGRAQHEAVGPGGAVAVTWSLEGLGDQIA